MSRPVYFACILIALISNAAGFVKAQVVMEVPRPFMPGVAKTVVRGNQAVIYYNPVALRRMGPAMDEFVRAHEYGHIRLGHFRRNMPQRIREAEADIYAARVASPRSVLAARQWFISGNGGGLYHGSPRARAARVSRSMSFQHNYRLGIRNR